MTLTNYYLPGDYLPDYYLPHYQELETQFSLQQERIMAAHPGPALGPPQMAAEIPAVPIEVQRGGADADYDDVITMSQVGGDVPCLKPN